MTLDPLDSLTDTDLQELAAIEDEFGPANGIFAVSPDWLLKMAEKEDGKIISVGGWTQEGDRDDQ